MQISNKGWQIISGINGFMALIMGAVAAHGLSDAQGVALANKASFYQIIHAVILMVISEKEGKLWNRARWSLLLGLILFCGSIYARALFGWEEATSLAPIGGVCLMLGWALIAASAYKTK